MKWWDQMRWSSFSECWALSQLFHSTLSLSSRGFLVPLHFLPLEKAMARYSSTLARKIPWTEEPGRLRSMGSRRVGHDWATWLSLFTFLHWRRKWQPTPVLSPGESQGWGSLMGCRLWGRTESDTTEATQQQHSKIMFPFQTLITMYASALNISPIENSWYKNTMNQSQLRLLLYFLQIYFFPMTTYCKTTYEIFFNAFCTHLLVFFSFFLFFFFPVLK